MERTEAIAVLSTASRGSFQTKKYENIQKFRGKVPRNFYFIVTVFSSCFVPFVLCAKLRNSVNKDINYLVILHHKINYAYSTRALFFCNNRTLSIAYNCNG